jgi:hypothetical protein
MRPHSQIVPPQTGSRRTHAGVLRRCLTAHRSHPKSYFRASQAQAGGILAANNPGTADDFKTWSRWALLVPHVLAVDPAAPVHGEKLRDLACGASWYLLKRGDTDSGYELSGYLRAKWLDQLGADHLDTLRASTRLAVALRMMGHYKEASELNKDTLCRRRSLYGNDHPPHSYLGWQSRR